MSIGLAIVGAGYWGPNLVRTALATPAFQLEWFHVNWLSPTKIRTSVFGGSRRTIVWDDTNPARRLAVHDRGVDKLQAAVIPQDERRQALISYRTGDTLIPALPEREALMSVMAEFSTAISERRPPLTDAQAGLRVLKLLEAASRSVDIGGSRISLP